MLTGNRSNVHDTVILRIKLKDVTARVTISIIMSGAIKVKSLDMIF